MHTEIAIISHKGTHCDKEIYNYLVGNLYCMLTQLLSSWLLSTPLNVSIHDLRNKQQSREMIAPRRIRSAGRRNLRDKWLRLGKATLNTSPSLLPTVFFIL